MDWILRGTQVNSVFSELGFMHPDGYHINENCNVALETILHNILTEDKYLRAYRRSISFGQNIKKDLIPLLIHAKEDTTIELLVRILVNLSIPIECLLSVEVTSQSDFGLHVVFEINQLLTATKAAFTGARATKVVVDFLKKNVDPEMAPEQCSNISNSLLLLRNVLHIPEDIKSPIPGNNVSVHAVQNQILWNMFSQSIDKVLIKLMTIPEAANWAVTMVQLIALLYKDQHVVSLHKLLNMWLESCNSESSEDNESNTSPPDRGSEDSSPMLTSDPTSDSSDTGGSGKSNDEPNSENNGWGNCENNTMKDENQPYQPPLTDENDIHMRDQDASTGDENMKSDNEDKVMSEDSPTETSNNQQPAKVENEGIVSENSDCGYGTQIENQESISTSSNDDEVPLKKPVHQKPHNPKQRVNTKARTGITLQEKKRKKIVKRGKANIINVQGLTHQTPTDDDISNVIKEFTVDFLLKGFNYLVQTLHSQILTNDILEIDTSHFFWLVTYFLKFATQIELDLEQFSEVLSFDIVSYLTAEGVNLCEQFELAVKLDGNDLKPSSRRLHLVVTAIREFVQAIEVYKKFPHICADDKAALITLQNKMCETDELRSLLVLLLRHYNPKYHAKQYLQDLIVTNHILLTFVDSAMKNPTYSGATSMVDHIKQFATPEIMYQYGLLLEDYAQNGEFINDCVFTIMHHVGGDLDSLISLYQPKILKTFTSIWKSEFEICDDWSDLIEYVINTFIKKPNALVSIDNFRMDTQIFDDKKFLTEKPAIVAATKDDAQPTGEVGKKKSVNCSASQSSKERWTEEELSSLSWNYLQSNTYADVVGEILKCLKEDGTVKSRESVIRELFKENIINKNEFDKLSKSENKSEKAAKNKEMRDAEIGKLCEQLRQDGKTKCFDWVQHVLLETCYAKVQIEKRCRNGAGGDNKSGILQFKLFNQGFNSPVMSPVSYHALLLNQSVPLVPWNCEQAAMCKDLKFLQLLHKLGFQMPVDTGKLFIRIPHVWSADVLYEVAGRVAVIDTTKLKFSIAEIKNSGYKDSTAPMTSPLPTGRSLITAPENCYQVHKQRHVAALMNFTPRPGSSFSTDVQNETNKRCWLEVVQQSRELKLTCTVGSVLENGEELAEPKAPVVQQVEPPTALPLILPPKDFIAHLSELEDNNSVSETASVASDLTRMYVSDEDEKLELALRPLAKTSPVADDAVRAERPTVYAPTF